MQQHKVTKVWVDSTNVYAKTADGLTANYPISMWKRLAKATEAQLQDFYLSYMGIHWPQLDEDLSFEGMFEHAGLGQRTPTEDSFHYEAS